MVPPTTSEGTVAGGFHLSFCSTMQVEWRDVNWWMPSELARQMKRTFWKTWKTPPLIGPDSQRSQYIIVFLLFICGDFYNLNNCMTLPCIMFTMVYLYDLPSRPQHRSSNSFWSGIMFLPEICFLWALLDLPSHVVTTMVL